MRQPQPNDFHPTVHFSDSQTLVVGMQMQRKANVLICGRRGDYATFTNMYYYGLGFLYLELQCPITMHCLVEESNRQELMFITIGNR